MLQQVGEVMVESVTVAGRAEVAREVGISHVHVQILSVVEVRGAEAAQLQDTTGSVQQKHKKSNNYKKKKMLASDTD